MVCESGCCDELVWRNVTWSGDMACGARFRKELRGTEAEKIKQRKKRTNDPYRERRADFTAADIAKAQEHTPLQHVLIHPYLTSSRGTALKWNGGHEAVSRRR